jgi:hypothetical protein
MQLQDYTRVYENVLTEEFCNNLIWQFGQAVNIRRHDSSNLSFDQLVMNHTHMFRPYMDQIFDVCESVKNRYLKDCDIEYVPTHAYELCKMKKYTANVDHFDTHIDSADAQTGHRFLVILFYLNTIDAGETEFTTLGLKVPAVQGNVLVFPSNFLYPHKGNIPLQDKYIFSTYLLCD